MTPEQLHALLKELLARLDNPLPQMQPIEVALKDPLPREARTKQVGVTRKVTFDLDKETYDWLMVDIPETAILKGILWLEEPGEIGEAVTPAKPKRSKTSIPKDGPHGEFWQEMFLEGVIGQNDFKQLTGVADGLADWHETIRALFETPSLTNISPDTLLLWLVGRAQDDLIDKVRRIAKSQEPEFPVGQYYSPFDLGAKPKVITTDEQYARENQLP